ncbi:hypothetical protein MYO4S_00206 [Serratia phage 4S]|nr:hypothetical protein MYO4S_00206 [Serratia phage 4S]
MESEHVDQTFTYSLTEEGAKFKSINIVDSTSNPGITITGARYSGQYSNVFSFGGDALRYRKGDEYMSAGSFESLPPPREADLFLWRAPTNLRKTFSYTVELKYTLTTSDNENPPVTTEKVLRKTYTQDVVGNWSIWSNKLRDYVNAGK